MKKVIILMALACSTAFVTQAQKAFGVKGGFGISNALGASDMDGKQSYKLGLALDRELSKFVSICPALYFSNKGYEKSISETDLTLDANYLELPVCLAFNIHFSKGIKISANIGPYVAYGIGGKTKLKGNGLDESWKTFKDKTIAGKEYGATERFDWGATAGASLVLSPLHIGVNYDLGLQDIYSMPKANRKEQMRNGMWWISLGLLF